MLKRQLQNTAVIATAIAAAIAAVYSQTQWLSKSHAVPREHCYGIVQAAKNDCATALHACAYQAPKDAMSEEWIMLPKGTCSRIVGGIRG